MSSTGNANAVTPAHGALSSWGSWLWLCVALVVAAVPRLYELETVNYWFDESFTLKMAEYGPVELLERLPEDTHPPFFYFLLKLWNTCLLPLGASPRGLSVLCGLMTVAGVYAAVIEAFRLGAIGDARDEARRGRFAAVLAALLVGLSPLQISWSNQVRMYSLMTALAAVSSAMLLRALRPDATRGHWIAFTVATTLQAYTHFYGLFLIVAQYAFGLGYAWWANERRDGARSPLDSHVLLSAAGAYLLFLPWQLPFWEQRARVDDSFHTRRLTWTGAGETLGQSFDLQLAFPATGTVGAVVALAIGLVLAILIRSRRPGLWFLGLAGLTPFVLGVVASLGLRNIFAARYVMSGQMFLLASAAAAIALVRDRRVGTLLAAALLGGTGWLTFLQCRTRHGHAELPGMRQAAHHLDTRRKVDEPVVVVNPMLFTTLVQYLKNRDGARVIGEARQYPYFQGTAAMREREYVSRTELDAYAGTRFWTVDADLWFGRTWKTPVPPGWNEAGRMRFRDFYAEIVVRRYERADAR